ncbi:MAG: CYTH domain-containing protein [Selenomonadaceae bacterium]|nr:CYTH domain-containing protein [Selenomonadaceae bacterium]
MGIEIERKYLLTTLPPLENGVRIIQGYLSFEPLVRVRLAGSTGRLTMKFRAEGIARREYEYEIPASDAEELFERCRGSLIEKVRYRLGRIELYVFEGDNDGLIVAEIELSDEHETVALPDWIGREVTGLKRYLNCELVKRPYKVWTRAERFDE